MQEGGLFMVIYVQFLYSRTHTRYARCVTVIFLSLATTNSQSMRSRPLPVCMQMLNAVFDYIVSEWGAYPVHSATPQIQVVGRNLDGRQSCVYVYVVLFFWSSSRIMLFCPVQSACVVIVHAKYIYMYVKSVWEKRPPASWFYMRSEGRESTDTKLNDP